MSTTRGFAAGVSLGLAGIIAGALPSVPQHPTSPAQRQHPIAR